MKSTRLITNLIINLALIASALGDITIFESDLSYIDAGYGYSNTFVTGISGQNIVGWYQGPGPSVPSGPFGFIKNLNSGTIISYRVNQNNPGVGFQTYIRGISGNYITGTYSQSGIETSFIKDISANDTSYFNLSNGLYAKGIDGEKVVGMASTGVAYSFTSFSNDGNNSLLFSPPNSSNNWANGISGSKIIGQYYSSSNNSLDGYVYDGSSFKSLIKSEYYQINPIGIDGNLIVGSLYDSLGKQHGFIYDGSNYTLFDVAGATGSTLTGISGTTVTGTADGKSFVAYNVPEPSALSLLAIGLGGLAMMRRRRS